MRFLDPPQRTTAYWVSGLYALIVVLQRFAVPGLPVVALVLPLFLAWCVLAWMWGVVEVHPVRLVGWFVAAGATAAGVLVQSLVVTDPIISPTSWALFMVTWLPFTLRLVDRRTSTYLAALKYIVAVTVVLAVGCIVMTVTQLAGLDYQDWLANIVPANLLLQDFVITYPVNYGSELYRANAWIGLEPSIVSMQLGLGLLAALILRSPPPVVLLLAGGLLCTGAGSGFAIVLVGVVVMLLHPIRRSLRHYAALGVATLLVALTTSIGQSLLSRTTEATSSESSTSLRAVVPYEFLWPTWIDQLPTVLFGRGAGSSQQLVGDTGILGLLVPTPIKIFFDYGLIAGLVLAVFLLCCYFGGPSRSIAVSLLVSLWLLQPGTTTAVVVAPVALLVAWWSPRPGAVLESNGDIRSLRRKAELASGGLRASKPEGVLAWNWRAADWPPWLCRCATRNAM